MKRSSRILMQRGLGLGLLLAGIGLFGSPAQAQSAGPVVVMLDSNTIGLNAPVNRFSEYDINGVTASLGLRDLLPFFLQRVGQRVELPLGPAEHAGWFAFSSVPPAWASASATGDPLADFVVAGAGLGSPDEAGDRGSLLDSVPGVFALSSGQAQALVGRTVCGIVFAGEIVPSAGGTSLRGANLGLVAFGVNGVTDHGTIDVQIRDAIQTCSMSDKTVLSAESAAP